MRRVLLLGAGAPAANGFARSLKLAGGYTVIGASTSADDALFTTNGMKIIRQHEGDDGLLALCESLSPVLVHGQPDTAVALISRLRSQIRDTGCTMMLPRTQVIDTCHDKWLTYLALHRCGVPVPRTSLSYADFNEPVHIRPRVGAGGKGSEQGWFSQSRHNPDFVNTIAELLPGPTVTWQALYSTGSLVASQLRRRLAWTGGDRGSAKVSETFSDPAVARIAKRAVMAVDIMPHGIYGVDMTLDADGQPRVTEINIGRFFTTIEFFARAGLNMPDLFCKLAFGERIEPVGENPLPDGLRWVRSMDEAPVLV